MLHNIVYADDTMYAGWPANHGAWQWGDEFLVGFLRGTYGSSAMHNIKEPFQKVLARSVDAGETWVVEEPAVDFECVGAIQPSHFNLHKSIIRVCGRYDHGGEYCDAAGGFYLSVDRGHVWDGPFSFNGLDQFSDGWECSGRTCVLGGLVFLSRKDVMEWGRDSTFVATHDGEKFVFLSWVSDDGGRAVMPAVAAIGSRIVVCVRRRGLNVPGGWVDSYYSDDDGMTWSAPVMVGRTGGNNGNPPAVVALGDRLVCVFGNRTEGAIKCCISSDGGETWIADKDIRSGGESDIGYPRLFVRSDGKLTAVYYWSDGERKQQYIASTVWAC